MIIEFLDQEQEQAIQSVFPKFFYRKRDHTVKEKSLFLFGINLGDIYRRYHTKAGRIRILPTKVCSTETLLNNLNRIH